MGKVVLIGGVILVLVVVVFAGYKFSKQNQTSDNMISSKGTNPTISSPPQTSKTSNKSDTSDKALDQDFQDVQGSLNKLDKDQNIANSDSSSQDTPLTQ